MRKTSSFLLFALTLSFCVQAQDNIELGERPSSESLCDKAHSINLSYGLNLYFMVCMDVCLNSEECNPVAGQVCKIKAAEMEEEFKIQYIDCIISSAEEQLKKLN